MRIDIMKNKLLILSLFLICYDANAAEIRVGTFKSADAGEGVTITLENGKDFYAYCESKLSICKPLFQEKMDEKEKIKRVSISPDFVGKKGKLTLNKKKVQTGDDSFEEHYFIKKIEMIK
jgi:hypothetical protein